jgi:uncharacterized membrane protein YhaH (DUF805 family)
MGLGEAVSTCFSNYANFYGRARRSEYWFWQLFIVLIVLAFVLVGVAIDKSAGESFIVIPFAIAGIFYLGIVLPSLAVTVRRLHDINCSGWFILLSFIPYIGGLIVFVMTVIPGTKGANNYGPDPNPVSAAEVF